MSTLKQILVVRLRPSGKKIGKIYVKDNKLEASTENSKFFEYMNIIVSEILKHSIGIPNDPNFLSNVAKVLGDIGGEYRGYLYGTLEPEK